MQPTNNSRNLRRARAQHEPRATGAPALAMFWSALRRGAARMPGTALLLLFGAALLVGARLSWGTGTGAGASQRLVTLRVSPPDGLPPLARWADVTHGTAYTVVTPGNGRISDTGYQFTFTTPAGDQVLGQVPISRNKDGSYQQTSLITPAGAVFGCREGELDSSKSSGGMQLVAYTLEAHFDRYMLVAYAQLVYAVANDKSGTNAVCSGQTGQAGEQSFEMSSGCDLNTCVSPVDTAGPTVTAFDSAVVSAAKQGNAQSWQPAYANTSRAITAQYSSNQFGSVIQQQVKQQGRIVAISPQSSSATPHILFDTAGQAYFTVTDSVKLDKGGATSTVTVTSYYLLQSGQWVFWFSMPIGS